VIVESADTMITESRRGLLAGTKRPRLARP
jgi:hypothetical protein